MTGHDQSEQHDPGEAGDLASKQVFTTGEAAKVCNVSQQTIIRCFDRGRLTGFRVPGSKFRRIPRAELLRFMQDNGIPLERLEGGSRRVVIVASDAGAARALAEGLAGSGRFRCAVASTAFSAGLLIGATRPHAVVLHPSLVAAPTDSLLASLREREETRGARVLYLASPANGAAPAGVDGVVSSSASPAAIAERLADMLGLDPARAGRR